LTVTSGIVLVVKTNLSILKGYEPPVGDGDSMGVSGKIVENLLGTSEGSLGVDHPFSRVEWSKPTLPGGRLSQALEFPMKTNLTVIESLLEISKELASEKTAKDSNRKEEVLTRGKPALFVKGDTATRNDTMKVGMVMQVLSPSVENRQEADLCTEMLRISSDGQKRFRGGTKKDSV
jgi:hypothetical protein